MTTNDGALALGSGGELTAPPMGVFARAGQSKGWRSWVTTVDPGAAWSRSAVVLAIVQVGKTSASSLPSRAARRASSLRCHGSSRRPK